MSDSRESATTIVPEIELGTEFISQTHRIVLVELKAELIIYIYTCTYIDFHVQ